MERSFGTMNFVEVTPRHQQATCEVLLPCHPALGHEVDIDFPPALRFPAVLGPAPFSLTEDLQSRAV